MRKEVLLAISMGFLLGLIITFGIYTANKALKNRNQAEKKSTTTPLPSPVSQSLDLKIFEPENNLVVYENEINLRGEIDPESIISILGEDDQQIIFQTGKEGTFSAKIKLISGANEIKIVGINPEGKRIEKDLTLVFSKTQIEP